MEGSRRVVDRAMQIFDQEGKSVFMGKSVY
jgi:hypothetical protein